MTQMQVRFTLLQEQSLAESAVYGTSDASGHSFFCFSAKKLVTEEEVKELTDFFSQAMVSSALDLHHISQKALEMSAAKEIPLQLVSGLFNVLEGTCTFCSLAGQVLLKRGEKTGKILDSVDTLQVVEGKLKEGDEFLFVLGESVSPKARIAILADGKQLKSPLESAAKVTTQLPQISLVQSTHFLKTFQQKMTAFTHSFQLWMTALISQDVYVRQKATQRTVRMLVPLLVLLVVGVAGFVFLNERHRQDLRRAQEIIQPIEQQLVSIKETAMQSPLQAREQTEQLVIQLEESIKTEAARQTTVKELQTELHKIKEYYHSISGLEEFEALLPFYDLRLVKSDFLSSKMDLQNTTAVFLDAGQNKVIALETSKKQWTDLPVGETGTLKDLILNGNDLYLLGNGIHKVNLTGTQNPVQLAENTEFITDAIFLRRFDIYL
jgi:hypothetical protein